MKPELVDQCVAAAMRTRDQILEEMGFAATKSVEELQRQMIIAALERYEKGRKEEEREELKRAITA